MEPLWSLKGEGFQNVGSCCGAVVFMDQSAESVAALDLSVGRWRVRVCRVGCEQRESAVWALAVVMGGVDAEHCFEVAAAEDQEPVGCIYSISRGGGFVFVDQSAEQIASSNRRGRELAVRRGQPAWVGRL
jgi:hypothetical protein